ncbi:hypothetical protein HDE_01032 [Halotydeus destructor]|nr:hypothetical protein HDE_01032 [Halotydeus destructor]
MAYPVSEWKTQCGLTQDAMEESKAVIGEVLDALKSTIQDWARGDVEHNEIAKTCNICFQEASHVFQRAQVNIESFLGKLRTSEIVSDDEVKDIRQDIEIYGNVKQLLQYVSEMEKIHCLKTQDGSNDAEIEEPGDDYAKVEFDSHVNEVLSDMSAILYVDEIAEDLVLYEERAAKCVDNFRHIVLEAVDKIYKSIVDVMSAKFGV